MGKKTVLSNISVYSISHALIDATCAATLMAMGLLDHYDPQYLFHLIVLYNVLAFSTQPLFGLVLDKFKAPVYGAVLGALLVAASTLLLQVPLLAALLAGIGNALFHVGGGVVVLNLASGKAALPGIYVAPGALGLMIGTTIGKSGHFVAWPFVLVLVLSILLILRLPKPKTSVYHKSSGDLTWFETVILLLLFSIVIRGLVGLSLILPWKSNPALLVALTSAIVLGKAFGGILGDKFGWAEVALTGLSVSAIFLTFFAHTPFFAIIGAFFFNLTMPITLTCLANMLVGNHGFAFGLTTLALIIGAAPTFTQLRILTGKQIFIFVAILVSISALYGGLRLYTRHFSDRAPVRENQM